MKKNLILSITSISTLLTTAAFTTISCNNNIANSEETPNLPESPIDPSNPIVPDVPEIPSTPPIDDINSNTPIIESVQMISNIDKFEIEIIGKNLSYEEIRFNFINVTTHGIWKMNFDATKSNSSRIILYTTDFAFQNKVWKLDIIDTKNMTLFSELLTFGYMKIVDRIDEYANYIYNLMRNSVVPLQNEAKTLVGYIKAYNVLSDPKNACIELDNDIVISVSNIEVNYKNLSNNSSSFEYSVYFDVRYNITKITKF